MQALFVNHRQQLFIAFILLVLLSSAYLSLPQFDLSLNTVKDLANVLSGSVAGAPVQTFVLSFLLYLLVCSIPFPFMSVVTILMGYLFGPLYGLLAASFASAIGGCVLFWLSKRFLKKEWVDSFINRFPALESARQSQDFWIATSIRMIPGMPFFLPSIILSLTNISLIRFYFSTQLGLLLTLAIYINAGSSLATIKSLNDIFSPPVIASMALIALLPLTMKLVHKTKQRRQA